MFCEHNDCGWCYAPEEVITTSKEGACHLPSSCPQTFDEQGRDAVSYILNNRPDIIWPEPNLPPVNLNNSLSAYDFYPDDEVPPNEEDEW